VLANPLTTRQVLIDVLEEQRAIAESEMKRTGFDALIEQILTSDETR
jgi:hypothetical protein